MRVRPAFGARRRPAVPFPAGTALPVPAGSHNAIVPTYALTGTSGWPSSFTGGPTILVHSSSRSLGPGQSGRSLVIAMGDASLHGSFSWDGVILLQRLDRQLADVLG